MAIDRRVAASIPQQRIPSSGGGPVAEPGTATPPRLDHVPTQRGPHTPEAPPQHRRGRRVTLAVALTTSVALLVTTGVVQHQREVRQAERVAADGRVATAVDALALDAREPDATHRAGEEAWASAVAAARAGAGAAAASGTQDLAGTPHAGDAPRAALQAAVDVAVVAAADQSASLAVLKAAAAGVAAPAQTARDAEAAWQAAEAARIAAEQAAAERAAAEARAKAKPSGKKSSGTTRSTAPQGSGGSTGPQSIPAGGLVCKGAPVGAGGGESSVGEIGAAINDFRASQGLPALSVVRSGTLVGHAQTMANSGGIWHSGSDNIVGCTSGSVARLVNAWANSSGHRAQMMRTDVSTMKVGGASVGGWLYGAVKFS